MFGDHNNKVEFLEHFSTYVQTKMRKEILNRLNGESDQSGKKLKRGISYKFSNSPIQFSRFRPGFE